MAKHPSFLSSFCPGSPTVMFVVAEQIPFVRTVSRMNSSFMLVLCGGT